MTEARQEALRAVEGSLDRPSAARIYDYFIGGDTHYAIDREFAEKVRERMPLMGDYCRTSRLFLGRAVRHCVERGIRQFVDVGSGLPTAGNVHDVADEVRPEGDVRVVYVDNEPIALAHSTLLLADTADPDRHQAIAADLLDPEDLWLQVRRTGLIDLDQPVALVVNAVLHFIKDEEQPESVLRAYRRRLAPGSLLVLSQMTNENPQNEAERQALADIVAYYETTTNPGQLRTIAEFRRFFGDWELEPPGLVYAPAWHPDEQTLFAERPSASRVIGGVARKPAES
ncbi:SAM-dependent methyltransferase [Amycolatopsis magusensis]|uniref:SAM-dependent methyltransferase n=1 Tax=Amycolatopsis magusensis TaxID=882444 RepID=UPI0024A9EC32|nr:SAM-dependent methyltransferase [Amycolatopsis magusensis]MDI5979946.1 SAM-dependent methyltransferase [Amycolatopsis magusensis]